jgi:hypothetical protein
MKIRIFSIALISLFILCSVQAQTNSKKTSFSGTWKFEAPMAPEEYSSGKINVGLADKKYSVIITFSEGGYKIAGEQVKFENDTLSCTVFIEGEGVKVNLRAENGTKMTGTADYSQGQIPITMTRTVPDK